MAPVFLLLLLAGGGAIVVHPRAPKWDVDFSYHSHEQVTLLLGQICRFYPGLATMYSIGMTVNKKDLWVLRITSPKSSVLGTPNVKLIGNIHGNEPVGKELSLHLAEYLVKNYQTNEEVRWLLDRTVIHLLPSLNPDGFDKSIEGDCYSVTGRTNGNSVDLNRSFPDFFEDNPVPQQPETKAIIRWLSAVPFVLSGSFHGGTLVVSYPYENDDGVSLTPNYSTAPDDDSFRYLSKVYAESHGRMHNPHACGTDRRTYPGGIINGASWYQITGSMSDYNYVWHGCLELTLEVSCCKYPPAHELLGLWEDNRRAILELSKRVHIGVKGMIMNSMTGAGVPSAALAILGRDANFTSHKTGEFWRILLPGDYILKAEAQGYESQLFPFTVRRGNETFPEATWLNIYLKPRNLMDTSGAFVVHPTDSAIRFASTFVLYLNLRILQSSSRLYSTPIP